MNILKRLLTWEGSSRFFNVYIIDFVLILSYISSLKRNKMSYNKMSNTELISVIVEKEYQVKDLTEKNERLEAAQLAFDAELEKEFKKMEAMNVWQRFIKGFSIGIQIYQTYMKARQEYFERPKKDSNPDLSKHLIND